MKIILIIIALSFFVSCAGSNPTLLKSNLILSKEKAYSKISNIYINLPNDWFIAEDNECNCTDLWIVKNDYSESITFRKIKIDEQGLKEIEDNGLDKISYLSKMFVRTKMNKNFKGFSFEDYFELNGKSFSAFVYKNSKNQSVRTVVFNHYNSFYECEAIRKDGGIPEDLYKTQNAVLSTLN